MAPSQVAAAVAGVQKLSRQQSSLVPFFQTVPSVARQLSIAVAVCAPAMDANAAVAITKAILFSFFIFLLKGKVRSNAAQNV
jgi:hypothetical protein